jgi:uncharacterized protein YbjT (DUF2867 family)
MTMLVTGGTGTLGRPTVRLLRTTGHKLRAFSRKPGPGRVIGNLASGAGLAAALDGVDTVLHLANGGFKEADETARLIAALDPQKMRHLFYISIVGVDKNPFAYYRQKLESERRVEASGIPFTILRATQFHDFIARFLRPQTRMPAVILPKTPVQPIAVQEVAARIGELVDAGPSGHVPDIEGPEQRGVEEFAAEWFEAHGRSKRIWLLSLPGASMRAFQSGVNLGKLPGYGRETFAEYAEADAAAESAKAAAKGATR